MIVVVLSAAFVGMIHSLAPAHWLPVVLVARSRRWGVSTALAGALTAASGHIIVTILLGAVIAALGAQFLSQVGETIERLAGAGLAGFGLLYAGWAYSRHRRCGAHGHHGPEIGRVLKRPFALLFVLGFTPCLAVLPVFIAAAPFGALAVAMTVFAFCAGVLVTLLGATAAVTAGIMNLDIPLIEHHGESVAGLGIAAAGALLALGVIG